MPKPEKPKPIDDQHYVRWSPHKFEYIQIPRKGTIPTFEELTDDNIKELNEHVLKLEETVAKLTSELYKLIDRVDKNNESLNIELDKQITWVEGLVSTIHENMITQDEVRRLINEMRPVVITPPTTQCVTRVTNNGRVLR